MKDPTTSKAKYPYVVLEEEFQPSLILSVHTECPHPYQRVEEVQKNIAC